MLIYIRTLGTIHVLSRAVIRCTCERPIPGTKTIDCRIDRDVPYLKFPAVVKEFRHGHPCTPALQPATAQGRFARADPTAMRAFQGSEHPQREKESTE
jgi:hypothetical protein